MLIYLCLFNLKQFYNCKSSNKDKESKINFRLNKNVLLISAIILSTVLVNKPVSAQDDQNASKILIVSGGKKIDTSSFLAIFDSLKETDYDTISKPRLFGSIDTIKSTDYSVFVFYDSYSETTPKEDSLFLELAGSGTGMLFLHHSITSHQENKEYQRIVGGRYHYEPWYDGNKKYGPSTYKHDQVYTVKIIDEAHPVTKGIPDFTIHDEAYINMEYNSDIIPLLTSDNCESVKIIGWANNYKNSRVVYFQPGHDANSYSNRYFRQLIYNAIKWVQKNK